MPGRSRTKFTLPQTFRELLAREVPRIGKGWHNNKVCMSADWSTADRECRSFFYKRTSCMGTDREFRIVLSPIVVIQCFGVPRARICVST